MTTITDISNYKHCRRKQADYWMCIPPKGTIVFNKSEATYLSKQMNFLKRRPFMTAAELQQLKEKNQSLYDIVMRIGLIVKDNNSNVIIYCAETWQVMSYRHVCNNYLAYQNNKLVDINSIIKERTTNLKNEKVVDWFRVQVKQETKQYFACFVPVNESGVIPTSNGKKMPYNHTYIEHGKGDFIVCEAIGDKPNLSTASVVNGSVFPIIYDNRGWTEYITISRVNFDEPPKLWKITNNISDSSRTDTMVVKSKNNRAGIRAMVDWYKKYNLKSHCEFLIQNGDSLDGDTISHIRASRKVCEYLIQRHKFKITGEQFNNTGSIRDINYAIIVLKSEECVINSVIPSTLSGWNNDPYSAYNDIPLEETIISLEDLDSFVDDLIKNIPRYHLLIKALNKNKCDKDIINSIESSMDEWYAQLDSPHFFSVDDVVGFLTEVSRVYNKYGEKGKIQVNIIDNCIKCIF